MRRKELQSKCTLAVVGAMPIHWFDFLVALDTDGSAPAQALLANFLCWLSRVVEHRVAPLAGNNPLFAPVSMGVKKTRRIPRELKDEVLSLMERKLVASGSKAMELTKRFSHFARGIRSAKNMNVEELNAGMRMLSVGAETFRASNEAFLSLALEDRKKTGRCPRSRKCLREM